MTEDAQNFAGEEPRIRIVRDGRCVTLTLNRPERRNALDATMLDAIEAALGQVETDRELVALILTGAPPVFCAGADLKEALPDPLMRVERMHRLVLRFTDLAMLTVAAIEGAAMGGGLELALACDLRIASRTARLGLPEIGMGFFPAYGGTQLLPHTIGLSRAIEMVLGGEAVDAESALAIGLVDQVAATDAVAAARVHCARFEQCRPTTVGAALHALRAGKRDRLLSGLPEERAALARLLRD